MIVCPYCGAENIEGEDFCGQCEHSLTDLSLPRPSMQVERGLLKDRIKVLAPKKPVSVSPETPIQDVLDRMTSESIGCVMVVEDDQLTGIFSERDALLKVSTDAEEMSDQSIASVMTPNPETLEENDKIAFALHRMHVGGYRHIPILANGRLTGVISIRDILAYLTVDN